MPNALASLYSAIDTGKRRLKDFVSNPGGSIDRGVSAFREDQNALQNLFANAYPMAGDKTVLNSPEQIAGFQREAADAAANMGLAGVIKVSFKPESSWLSAKSENGLVGGHVRDGALRISHADLAESARGKGEGVKLYQSLIDDAHSKGLNVFSDSTVELPAVRVYEALSRRGYDVKRLGGGILDDGAAYGPGATSPAFSVSKSAKAVK